MTLPNLSALSLGDDEKRKGSPTRRDPNEAPPRRVQIKSLRGGSEAPTGVWKLFDQGPSGNIAPEMLTYVVRAQLDNVTTLEGACELLEELGEQRTTESQLAVAIWNALHTEGSGEAFAQRILRADMGLDDAFVLPAEYPSWLGLLQQACTLMVDLRAGKLHSRSVAQDSIVWRSRSVAIMYGRAYLDNLHITTLWDACRHLNALEYLRTREDNMYVLSIWDAMGEARVFSINYLYEEGFVEAFAKRVLCADMDLAQDFVLPAAYPSWLDLLHDACEVLSNRRLPRDGARMIFLNSRAVVLGAMEYEYYGSVDAMALEYVAERLKDDRGVVLAAVRKNGMALQYASERLKDDREVVLAAVRNNEMALQYASKRLQDDSEGVRASARGNEGAYEAFMTLMQRDPEGAARAFRSVFQ